MAGVQGGWVLRPFTGAAEHGPVEALWLAALQGRWPLLPRAVAMVRDGFFAVGGGRVGFVAVDLAGSIPLVLCHARAPASRDRHRPAQRRAGPAARRRRQHGPRGRRRHGLHLAGRAAGPARGGTPVHHPNLARWFQAGNRDILLARDGAGTIVATLLLDGPARTPSTGRPPPSAASGSCPRMEGRGVGSALVARASEILRDRGAGTCHIGWTVRESFYARADPPWLLPACASS